MPDSCARWPPNARGSIKSYLGQLARVAERALPALAAIRQHSNVVSVSDFTAQDRISHGKDEAIGGANSADRRHCPAEQERAVSHLTFVLTVETQQRLRGE